MLHCRKSAACLLVSLLTLSLQGCACQTQLAESTEGSASQLLKPRRTLRTQTAKVGSGTESVGSEAVPRKASARALGRTGEGKIQEHPGSQQLESSSHFSEDPSSVSLASKPDLPDHSNVSSPQQLRIPKILHQLYFVSDKNKDYETGSIVDKQFPKKWQASCKAAFPGWEYKFWNLESAEEWMSQKFPEFMKTWHAYPRTVLKGDAFRAFVMKDMGGLYLDLDIECFKHREHMLYNLDLVLQVAYPGAWDLDNGAFASIAGHPYWDVYIKLLKERAGVSPAEGPLRYDHVVKSTGPDVTYDAYLEWGKPEVRHGFVTNRTEKAGLVSMAYPLGEWYFPCLWDAVTCHADMNERKRNFDFPEHLAGHHYSVVSWFKELGERI